MEAYLDHASTSPLRPEALAAMLPYLAEHHGNPSGAHRVARRARRALDEAREQVAACLGCRPGEVVFTATGTEADNLAVLGAAGRVPDAPGRAAALSQGRVLAGAVEHHAVLRAAASVGATVVPVDGDGLVDLAALEAALHPGVALVSVMAANNEVGAIEPITAVAERVRALAPGALVHTDAVAAVPWVDPPALTAAVDLLSVAAHKFGGPKGAGALVVRDGVSLAPVLHGGGQERDRRPGTHDVAAVVGMAAALHAATTRRDEEADRIGALRDHLADGLLAAADGVTEHGPARGDPGAPWRLPTIVNLRFEGVDNEELLLLLDEEGIAASAGAACASGAAEPSHVLMAMGLSRDEARSAVRFSLGHSSTVAEVDHVLAVVPKALERLRTWTGGPASAADG